MTELFAVGSQNQVMESLQTSAKLSLQSRLTRIVFVLIALGVATLLLLPLHSESSPLPTCLGARARSLNGLKVIEDRATRKMYLIEPSAEALVYTPIPVRNTMNFPMSANKYSDTVSRNKFEKMLETVFGIKHAPHQGKLNDKIAPSHLFTSDPKNFFGPQLVEFGSNGAFGYRATGQENVLAVYDLRASARKAELDRPPSKLMEGIKDWRARSTFADSVARWPFESVKFFIALGALSYIQLREAYAKDPASMENLLNSNKDSVGHIGFLMFIYANASCQKVLGPFINSNKLLRVVFGQTGLACGMAASNIVGEIGHFPGLRESMAASLTFGGQIQGTRAAAKANAANDQLDEAWKQFNLTQKLSEDFVPSLTSLLISTSLSNIFFEAVCFGSGVTLGTLSKVLASRAAFEGVTKFILGVDVAFKVLPQAGRFTTPGLVVTGIRVGFEVLNFMSFLYLDEIIKEPIRYGFAKNVNIGPKLEATEKELQAMLVTKTANSFAPLAEKMREERYEPLVSDLGESKPLKVQKYLCDNVDDSINGMPTEKDLSAVVTGEKQAAGDFCFADMDLLIKKYGVLQNSMRSAIVEDLSNAHAAWVGHMHKMNTGFDRAEGLFKTLIPDLEDFNRNENKERPFLLSRPTFLYGVLPEDIPKASLSFKKLLNNKFYVEVQEAQLEKLKTISTALSGWLAGNPKQFGDINSLLMPAYNYFSKYTEECCGSSYFASEAESASAIEAFTPIAKMVLSKDEKKIREGMQIIFNEILKKEKPYASLLEFFEDQDDNVTGYQKSIRRFVKQTFAIETGFLKVRETEEGKKFFGKVSFPNFLEGFSRCWSKEGCSQDSNDIPRFFSIANFVTVEHLDSTDKVFMQKLIKALGSEKLEDIADGLDLLNLALSPCKTDLGCWGAYRDTQNFGKRSLYYLMHHKIHRSGLGPNSSYRGNLDVNPRYARADKVVPQKISAGTLAILSGIRFFLGNPEPMRNAGEAYLQMYKKTFVVPAKGQDLVHFGTEIEDIVFSGPQKADGIDDALVGFVFGPEVEKGEKMVPKPRLGFSLSFISPRIISLENEDTYQISPTTTKSVMMNKRIISPKLFRTEVLSDQDLGAFDLQLKNPGFNQNQPQTVMGALMAQRLNLTTHPENVDARDFMQKLNPDFLKIDPNTGENQFWNGAIEDQYMDALMQLEAQYMGIIAAYTKSFQTDQPVFRNGFLGINMANYVKNRPSLRSSMEKEMAMYSKIVLALMQKKVESWNKFGKHRGRTTLNQNLMAHPENADARDLKLRQTQQENYDRTDWRLRQEAVEQNEANDTRFIVLSMGYETVVKGLEKVRRNFDLAMNEIATVQMGIAKVPQYYQPNENRRPLSKLVTVRRANGPNLALLLEDTKEVIKSVLEQVSVLTIPENFDSTEFASNPFFTDYQAKVLASSLEGISDLMDELTGYAAAINQASYVESRGLGAVRILRPECLSLNGSVPTGQGYSYKRMMKTCAH